MDVPTYLHLSPGDGLPQLESVGNFKAILVIEDDVTPEWQAKVSDWLVRNGCRYMMAWGRKCSEWDDSVGDANSRVFDYREIPDDKFVMTTWHDRDSLKDTFWYSAHAAVHPSLDLDETYIIHIAPIGRSEELLQLFREAQSK